MYALGIDIGSSSIKVSAVDLATSKAIGVVQEPGTEMGIDAPKAGWAEQDPEMWWVYTCRAIRRLIEERDIPPAHIGSIGIAYQMHGLVLLDREGDVLRPAIIWCDSRAVDIGKQAFDTIGHEWCLSHCLNSPGNFTASKLAWVRDNEAEVYDKIDKIMLPGDFIGYKLTGEMVTTVSGLSEGVMWDFVDNQPARQILSHMGIMESFLPQIKDSIGDHGSVTAEAAEQCGLVSGIPVTYRAGDQPNNAVSLGVLNPGQIAATGGTSGVIYAISDKLAYDVRSRINGFAHVNHTAEAPRVGTLLCINGAGIVYAWMRKNVTSEISYREMEELADSVDPGSDGLLVVPFGNGAERILEDVETGVHIGNLQLNRHGQAHVIRAGLEGIAFAFVYGFQIMRGLGIRPDVIRVGNDNLFQSRVFGATVANLLQCPIEVIDATGASGAAKASAVLAGVYPSIEHAAGNPDIIETYHPGAHATATSDHYQKWESYLETILGQRTSSI